MERIRKARREDISRIAEILIFAKRTAYRPIFQNDPVSFGQMQVLPLANQYLSGQLSLDETFVWEEEGVVKGLADAGQGELRQLYVDPFFQGQGVGGALLRFAVEQGARRLWVLEKNQAAVRFYQSQGFAFTGGRRLEEGTPEYVAEMALQH